MTSYTLHDFDLEMCEYVRDNFSYCLAHDSVVEPVRRLPSEFGEYLVAVRTDCSSPTSGLTFLLNDDELQTLEDLARRPWPHLDWRSYRELHKQSTLCTGEINRSLARGDGEKWAKASLIFTNQLEADYLTIHEGISIVRDWLCELRRCLEAMGKRELLPRPQGTFRTPTNAAITEPDASESVSGIEPNERCLDVGWHADDAKPPDEFKFGPLRGQLKQLAKWCLPGKHDARAMKTAERDRRLWIKRLSRNEFEAWFKNDSRFQESLKKSQVDSSDS